MQLINNTHFQLLKTESTILWKNPLIPLPWFVICFRCQKNYARKYMVLFYSNPNPNEKLSIYRWQRDSYHLYIFGNIQCSALQNYIMHLSMFVAETGFENE